MASLEYHKCLEKSQKMGYKIKKKNREKEVFIYSRVSKGFWSEREREKNLIVLETYVSLAKIKGKRKKKWLSQR